MANTAAADGAELSRAHRGSSPALGRQYFQSVTGPYGEAEDRIGRLAQRLVAYFDSGK